MTKLYKCFSLNWVLSLVLLLPITVATAQETTEFATSVIDFSSEYPYYPPYYDADWALGDASDGRRWIPQSYNGQREFLVLGYDNPIQVYQVKIVEDWGAGAVDTIYLRNASTGAWNKVFSTTAAYAAYSRTFVVDIDQTPYMVDAIRLAINSRDVDDWNAILAVSITGLTPSPSPNVSINSVAPSYTNTSPIPVTFTFNEPVTGFDISDIVVTNGSASNFSVISSTVYTADILPSLDGLVTVGVNANAALDEDSNGSLASRVLSRYYDTTAPSMQITGPNPTSGQFVEVRFTISENVSGFGVGDISATNGYINNFYTIDDDNNGIIDFYVAEIVPNETEMSIITVDVASAVFTDLAGNENTVAGQFTTTHYPPQFASSVIGFSSQYGDPYYQSPWTLGPPDNRWWIPQNQNYQREYLKLGFTTPLSVNLVEVYENWRSGAVDTIYLRNAITEVWNQVYSRSATAGLYRDRLSVNFAATTYPVDGVRLAINSPVIGDWNSIDAVSISGEEFPTPVLKITSSAPMKTGVSPIPFTFKFSKPVFGFDLSDLVITNGTAESFTPISTTVYTATIAPVVLSGPTTLTVSVLADAAIDANSNGNSPFLLSRIFESVAPTVQITSTASNPTLDNAFPVTFTFSEAPFGFDASDIIVTNGSIQNFSQLQSTVFYGEIVASSEGAVSVDVPAAVATDEFGNGNIAATPFTTTYTYAPPQFASSVIGFSSQYGDPYYQSPWTLGSPDGRWWIPNNYDGSREYLELGFTNMSYVQRIDIYENWGAGAVDTVYLRNAATGVWNMVYSTTAQYVSYTRTLTIRIGQTEYPVDAIRLAIDSRGVANWNAIDAVSIIGSPVLKPIVKITSAAPSTYNSPIPFTFTFNEDVTGFALNDISVTNGSATNLIAVSPSVYTADITPVVHGSVVVSAAENGATNSSAKGNFQSSKQSSTAFFYGSPQYATSVIGFSSEYPYSSYYQTPQLLNAPDGIWWIPSAYNGSREYLKLGFSTPTQVARIEVFENWQSGAIDTIYLRNAATGIWNKVYSTIASAHEYSRTLTINIPLTPYLVDAIRLAINSPAVSDWNAIDAVSISDIYRLPQSITFDPLANKEYTNIPFALTASGDSGNPVSYTSSDVNVATVNGNIATITGVGTTTFTASLGKSNSYAAPYSAAADVTQDLTVDMADQTITFAPLAIKKFSDPAFALSATIGTSPLPIAYSSSNTSVATISGNTVTIVGVGSSTITASQAGNVNYNPAADVDQVLTVNKADQSITFSDLRDRALTEPAFTISANGGASGSPVTFASSNTSVATVSGNTITLVGLGTTNITASQAGNSNYNAAADVIKPLVVNNKTSQTIIFSALPSKTFGDAAFSLTATGGTSGQPVTFTSSNTSVARVSGNTVTIIGGGSTTITASQTGNSTFNAANDVSQSLTINTASQTISFASLAAKTFGDAAFTLSATGGASGLPVTFASANTSVATISGNIVTIVGGGSVSITASQAGNNNYSAASNVPQTLTVNKANQTITFNALPTKAAGDIASTLTATTSSGLPVSYTSGNTSVATINGNTVTALALGTTTITALQAGNTNFNPATAVQQSLTVKNGQTITFNLFQDKTVGDAAFSLTGSASSGLAITYASSNTNVATVSGNTVTIVGAGVTSIGASQAGDANFAAAINVTQSLTVKKGTQSITFPALADKTVGDAPFTPAATSSSGLAVSYSSGSNKISISGGGQITIASAGRVSITASQPGDGNYSAAASVSRGFCIKPAKPIITITGDDTSTPTLTSSATTGNQWFKNGSAISGATNATLNIKDPGVYKVQVSADDCVSDFSSDTPLVITGDPTPKVTDISIYPNPVEDYLEISGLRSEFVNALVYDMVGHSIALTFKKEGKIHRANVQHMTTGAYLLRVTDEMTIHQLKFIKK